MQCQNGAHQHLDASHCCGLNASWHCIYTVETSLQNDYSFYMGQLECALMLLYLIACAFSITTYTQQTQTQLSL